MTVAGHFISVMRTRLVASALALRFGVAKKKAGETLADDQHLRHLLAVRIEKRVPSNT